MANEEQVALLRQGVEVWNQWREKNPDAAIDLIGAYLFGADLRSADLSNANLGGANLSNANLGGANLIGADLHAANLRNANLSNADLRGTNLSGADLRTAKLREAKLRSADLSNAILIGADLRGTNLGDACLEGVDLEGVDLEGVDIRSTIFGGSLLDEGLLAEATSEYRIAPPDVGSILFDAPKQMQVGIPKIVGIRITKKQTESFFQDLKHIQVDQDKVEKIRVSQRMSAELRGDAFQNDALSHEEQIIEDNDFTQWEWRVIPLKQGTQKLIAIITIILQVENERGVKTLPVLEKELEVQVNRIYSARAFVSQHWQWLIASAVIPIAGFILSR